MKWASLSEIVILALSIGFVGEVRLPKGPSVPVPMPSPPAPSAEVVLGEEMVYCVDSDSECVVASFPKEYLKITPAKGPLTVRGKFVDSPLKVETREFKGPFLYFVEPSREGSCELMVLPVGGKEPDMLRQLIKCHLGPRPPPPEPKPPEPKPPEPKPDVSPIPEAGLHVLITYDAKVDLTPQQNSILYGAKVRKYLEDNCVVGPDGRTKEYRIWRSVDDPRGESEKWQKAFGRPKTSLPWVLVSNSPKGGFEGPLPPNEDEFMKLLEKYK